MKKDLTAEEVRSLFDYNPDTGELSWKKKLPNASTITQAGTLHHTGYRYVRVNGKGKYLVHRIIFLFMNGRWPVNQIDHVNRERSDNRWCNLREATPHDTVGNSTKQINNTSGYRGVCLHKGSGKWVAKIGFRKKRIYLGVFDTKEKAAEVYNNCALIIFGEYANLNIIQEEKTSEEITKHINFSDVLFIRRCHAV